MGFRDDSRGVSRAVVFVLISGLLILFLGSYQLLLVPDLNKQVEAEHAGEVSDDFLQLRANALKTGQEGVTRSVSLQLGTRYPIRPLAFNPSPVSGTSRTTSAKDITVEGDISRQKRNSLCDSRDSTIPTRNLTYRADYNERSSEPLYVYENTVTYRVFDAGQVVLDSEQSVISGRTVTLLPTVGEYTQQSTDSEAIDLKGNNGITTEVSVGSGNNLEVEIPSGLPASTWEDELLSGEPNVVEVNDRSDKVEIVLEGDTTYTVFCRSVGVNTAPPTGDNEPRLTNFEIRDQLVCIPDAGFMEMEECDIAETVQYEADYAARDGDGDLKRVIIKLIDVDAGTVVQTEKRSPQDGKSTSGTVQLSDNAGERDDEYDIDVLVEDDNRNFDSDCIRDKADNNGSETPKPFGSKDCAPPTPTPTPTPSSTPTP